MKRCLVPFMLVSLACLAFSSAASAMTVNTTSDASGSGGSCSLREAITAATSNTIGGDCGRTTGDNSVTLPAGTYTLSDGTELLFASGPTVTITGADPTNPALTTIDAAGTPAIPRRVIEVASFGGATLKNLKVSGGLSAGGTNGVSAGQSGTFGANGGGILNNNNGSLTLDHVLVTDNFTGPGGSGANSAGDGHSSGNGAPGGDGGGIWSGTGASLSITASTISGNGTGAGGNGGDGGPGHQGLGHFPDGDDGGKGAYSGSGGGIYNLGSATITTSTVSGNSTGVGGHGGQGGQGAGELVGTSSAGNGGDGGRGGNGSWGVDPNLGANFQYLTRAGGGGIASFGNLTMSASTISGNNTGAGGLGGTAGVPGQNANSSFRDSGLAGDGGSAGIGGGLFVDGTMTSSQANLTNVTIVGNFTGNGGKGGAGYSGATGLGGGRGGYGGFGGGIWSIGANNLGPVTLTHVTISQNGLGDGGATGDFSGTFPRPGIRGQGAGVATGGRFNSTGSSVYFKNTLVANNGVPGTDVNCLHYYAPPTYVDLGDLGHNLSFPDSSCPGINGDPMLGGLGPNGGPTDTMLPASGSAAIGVVPAASCSATDQRGNARLPSGDTVCDIGAVETGLAAPQLQLSVLKSGTGGGTLTSSPTGINCGATCAATYTTGQLVTLTATPATGSTFSGWSGGGCGGTGQCAVTLNADTQVTATFTPSSTSPGGGGGPPAAPPGPTGQRAAAVKKCKKKKGRAKTNCLKKAKKLPV